MISVPHALLLLLACSALAGQPVLAAQAVEIPLEAEDFTLVRGWRVEDVTYFSSQPNLWSGTKIVADAGDEPALAVREIEIPEAGAYNVWVRYESCYGFGSVFTVSIRQGDRLVEAGTFGAKENIKFFPFGRGWAAQGPWYWHNTDYVYEYGTVDLAPGRAEVMITKGLNQRPAAKRVVDLVFITNDLELRCGNDWNWRGANEPPILGKFKRPYYLKVDYVEGDGPVVPTIRPRLWLLGYYKGPRDDYHAGRGRLAPAGELADEERLRPGESTGWLRLDVHTAMPAEIFLEKDNEDARLRLTVSTEPEGGGAARQFDWTGAGLRLICSVGMPAYERDIFGDGPPIITFQELVQRKVEALQAYEPPGRRAKRFFVQTSGISEDLVDLAVAAGINSLYYTTPAFIYGKDAPERGFNTSRGFLSVQNSHLVRACYEGDFSGLERTYREVLESQREAGLEDLPQEFKLIEEAGPPALTTLRQWPKMREQFVALLKHNGVAPTEVLRRETLARLAEREDKPTEEELWDLVELGDGSHAESVSTPALFYWSHVFRAELMARTCARATELLEEIFGPQTLASSGSFYPSTGQTSVLGRGDEPFTLFLRRGVTAYSSEISWGWSGTPDFIGPQVGSYEGALARALGKYYDCPRGTYVVADSNRGYTGEFIETYSYGLAANGFYRVNFYFLGYPGECSAIASSDIHKGVKRFSYNIGAVEDRLLDSDVVPAQVALGWNLTTDVWDLAAPPPADPREVSGNIYPQERCLLYLLLRHCQVPVDLLGEQDLTADYLSRYRVYFLVGDHLRPDSAAALREWVRGGGTLIAVAGGGLRDHCDRPLDTLKEVFGVEAAPLEKRAHCMRPKLELLHAAPIDRIAFSLHGVEGKTMDAYAYRQRITPSEGTQVLGRFMDGTAAVTLNRFGEGRAVLIGALPGLPYVRPAIPLLPYGRGGKDNLAVFVPTDYDPDVRAFMEAILGMAGVERPVVCSDPLVEATLLESRDEDVFHVALVNYDTEPKAGLTVRVSGLGTVRVEAAPGVTVDADHPAGGITLRTDLDKFRLISLASVRASR